MNEAPSREPLIMANASSGATVSPPSSVRETAATGEPLRDTYAMSHPNPRKPENPSTDRLRMITARPAAPRVRVRMARIKRNKPAAAHRICAVRTLQPLIAGAGGGTTEADESV